MSQSAAWVIQPAHTHIAFSVSHLGLTRTPGVFKRFAADLDFDDRNIEASRIAFEVETASIDTALDIRDEHLRGPEWLAAEAHPKATFKSRSVRRAGDDRYLIEGDFTLRGHTLPLTFDAIFTGRAVNPWSQAPVVGFEAVGVISRSAHGMGMFPGVIADEVNLSIAIELELSNDSTQ